MRAMSATEEFSGGCMCRSLLYTARDPIDAGLETTGLRDDPGQAFAELADPEAEKTEYDTAFAALRIVREVVVPPLR